MNIITKANIISFMENYHYFHDSIITSINYDIKKAQIEVKIDVFWSGETTKSKEGLETNKTRIRMVFNEVEECNNKELFLWDYIDNAYMKYLEIRDKELICFASDENDPMVYIVCESIEYEELK